MRRDIGASHAPQHSAQGIIAERLPGVRTRKDEGAIPPDLLEDIKRRRR